VIHSFSLNHGDPFVGQFAERLLAHITRPFYDMLRQWIYDGELSDPYLEFFVAEQQDLADTDHLDSRKGGATSVWEDKYKLTSAVVPSIITDQFANKVFLIGKSLNFIRHGCHDGSWVESYSKSASKELRYGDTATLEASIDEAYKATMARLIHLMATKFHLFEHLAALKKYLLLGAGDFIAVLMESLSSNLDRPANTQYRHTLTAQLEHAVRNSNAQYDSPDVLRRLDSRMLELSHGEIGWDVFTLEYKISPPVDVIVTPYGSKQYLKVFNFLWRVKRVEFALGSTWRRCMAGARGVLGAVDDKHGADWKSARCVVAEMIHFVNQLQYYILFEVIESSWNELEKAMHKPDSTLDDLITAHAAYLNSITRKGLLGSSTTDFTGQLHELLKIMLAYKDSVDQLYSSSVAEFTRRQDISAKISTRTAAGKWGISEREDESSPMPAAQPPAGLGQGVSEDDILGTQRKRLRELADRFKRKVTSLLGDLMAQPDADMRWLAMVMNFNDVYQPQRRKKRSATATATATASSGGERIVARSSTRERERIEKADNAAGDKGKGRARA
jgi:gamma-tubulin complex component 3